MGIRKILVFSLILLIVLPQAVQAEMVVVVNPANSTRGLSIQDIRNIYLFKKITWEDREKIVPINLRIKDRLRQEFSERLLGRGTEEMENNYLMRALSGLGQPPIIARSPEEVKELVQTIDGAIGYIDEKDVDASVKVILIEMREPIR